MGEQITNNGEKFRAESPEKSLEMKKQTAINLLVGLKNHWKDSDPREIILDPEKYEKWRDNVMLAIAMTKTNEILSSEITEKYLDLSKKINITESSATIEENLAETNQLIDETLNYLQEK